MLGLKVCGATGTDFDKEAKESSSPIEFTIVEIRPSAIAEIIPYCSRAVRKALSETQGVRCCSLIGGKSYNNNMPLAQVVSW